MRSYANRITARWMRSLILQVAHSLVIGSMILTSLAAGGSIAIAAPAPTGAPGTATPTATATLTPPSPTPSLTATETGTPTATLTGTVVTSTATASETATATDTATPSATETATVTGSPQPSDTPSATETATPTESATPTDTETATATDSPTASASATLTPTVTGTPVITVTSTPAVTATIVPTPTVTPTQTVAPTPTEAVFQIGANGGQVAPADSPLTIDFPAGAVTQALSVHYGPRAIDPAAATHLQDMTFAFELSASVAQGPDKGKDVSHFEKDLTLTVDLAKLGYKPGQVEGRLLWFGYYDEVAGVWVPVQFSLNQDANTASFSAQVDHFTVFGIGTDANPGWAFKFNEPIVALASGAAIYNYPLNLPVGRGGLPLAAAVVFTPRSTVRYILSITRPVQPTTPARTGLSRMLMVRSIDSVTTQIRSSALDAPTTRIRFSAGALTR